MLQLVDVGFRVVLREPPELLQAVLAVVGNPAVGGPDYAAAFRVPRFLPAALAGPFRDHGRDSFQGILPGGHGSVYGHPAHLGLYVEEVETVPPFLVPAVVQGGYLEPAKCDLIRRFFEFCRHEGKFDHFNNAARDLLFDAFVVHGLNVKVKDGSDEIRFGGRKESYPELFLSNNSDRLYNWFVVCGTDIKRVVYGHERRYLNWKHIFVSDHTRKLSKDVLELMDTALIEVENQRFEEERLNKETKDGN